MTPEQAKVTRLFRNAAKKLGVPDETIELALRGVLVSNDGSDWRTDFKAFRELTTELPKFVVDGLFPEKALTAIPAPSYNYKSHFAIGAGVAISTGSDYLGFRGPDRPIPVRYHVPEMNEAQTRQYMKMAGVKDDNENFLVRPMELGLWGLNEPRMLKSSEGAVVFLDTAGYFNPGDDSNNYQQVLMFANLVRNLLTNGALAVVGLFHPPKNTRECDSWTLENSILGSAAYGGMLRSCLRMQNLNPDLNDPDGWIYVQGLKNPGLKPFQLEGPPPLKMKVPPGESPYLRELRNTDPRKLKAFALLDKKVTHRKIAKELRCSLETVTAWRVEWEASRESQKDSEPTSEQMCMEDSQEE